jgi:hypothetical protein
MPSMSLRTPLLLIAACLSLALPASGSAIGVDAGRFTIDGKPTFLLGISYYGGLGASDQTLAKDLDDMKRHGFNWLRVWATWVSFGGDVSAVDRESGKPRPEQLDRLRRLLKEADARGIIVNVTLCRGNAANGPSHLQGLEPHRVAVESLVAALKDHPNWYLDLANERNVKDSRFTSIEDLAVLLKAAKAIDPKRLITASHTGDVSKEQIGTYLKTVGVDLFSIHRPRDENSAGQTAAKTKEYVAWIKETGRAVPLIYDEPFRRGYAKWQPTANHFLTDLFAAEKSGAAGWCFHTGDNRLASDGRPRRSFDLREKRLFDQLDEVEQEFLVLLLRRRDIQR